MTKLIATLTKELKTKKIIFGPKVALKKLKNIEKIYFSEDCPENIIKSFKKFENMINTELTKEELKELCKKSFNICVISILKEKKDKEKGEKKEKTKKSKEIKATKTKK